MTETSPHHSICVNKEKCVGCVACMKACPTRAIRVVEGKAKVFFKRCIDCGECFRVCPHDALTAMTTPTSDLNRFRYKVALPSPVLYSQFGGLVMPHEVLSVLKGSGFDEVYDEALMCEMTSVAIEEYLNENRSLRPFISSTCPVVIRLIQRMFPTLCKHIIPIEPPREIAAKNLRNEISEKKKLKDEDIGVIHITPCAAKMVSINNPVSLGRSHLDGAVSIKDVYNPMMMQIKKTQHTLMEQGQYQVSGIGMGWALPGSEVRGIKYHSVSVSGVLDTIRILEDLEAGRLKNIDYLECLICPDGCIGGPLTVENRFLAKSNILLLIRMFGGRKKVNHYSVKRLLHNRFFSFETEIAPRPFPPLDEDRVKAMEKLKLKEKIIRDLPLTDCGVCGAPDCQTLADDVVRGLARKEDCIFIEGGKSEK